jgi:hypothetical protein
MGKVLLVVIQCSVIITSNTADKHLFSQRGCLVSFVQRPGLVPVRFPGQLYGCLEMICSNANQNYRTVCSLQSREV